MNADQIIAKYKLDPGLFPSGLKERLACFLDNNGEILLDEVGLLLPINDLSMVYTCGEIFSPKILVAPNAELTRYLFFCFCVEWLFTSDLKNPSDIITWVLRKSTLLQWKSKLFYQTPVQQLEDANSHSIPLPAQSF